MFDKPSFAAYQRQLDIYFGIILSRQGSAAATADEAGAAPRDEASARRPATRTVLCEVCENL